MKTGDGMSVRNVLYVLLVFALVSCSSPKEVKLSGQTMGTLYSVVYYEKEKTPDQKLISVGIDSLLQDINLKMSTYIKDSELTAFNFSSDTSFIKVSDDLNFVIDRALFFSRESGGAFDITIGPLVNLWGFGPGERKDTIPTAEKIKEYLNYSGYEKIFQDAEKKLIRKSIPEVYCDLSAIAKGYGVDKTSEFLLASGVSDFMVEIGGEVRTNGLKPDGSKWRIGIADPDASGGIEKVVLLSGKSVATSGNYQNYFEKNGKRYSHTIDPKTGYPVVHNLASVTVIADNCTDADAAATAIDVMGTDEGLIFAKKLNLAVYMIVKDTSGFKVISNKNFDKYLRKE